MNFTTPLALLLLLTIPYIIWLGRPRNAVTPGRRRRDMASLVLRLCVMVLLILSLSGAQAVRAADELAVVFLIDASDSVSNEQLAVAESYVQTAMETMGPSDQAAVIVFGANALVDRPMSGLADLASISSVPQALNTDLGEAIRLGLALFPAGSGRRLVILSDGAETIGDSSEAARLAATAGVEIDYVPLNRPVGVTEALITDVNAPTRVSMGESFSIQVTVNSTANMPATLRVLADGAVVTEQAVQLSAGSSNYAVRVRAAEQEFVRYTVELVPAEDYYYQNNRLAAFTEVVGPPRVLIVAPDGTLDDLGNPVDNESQQLVLALRATGIETDRITPTDLPASLAQLSSYASIILMNVNAKDLTPRKMETLQSYVRDLGGGLVAIGGPSSYGVGGYFKTPLEELLPVDMQIKDQERFPSVSIVIVIDRSGSMGAQEGSLTKIQLAAEGAVRVVELLNDFDEITVIPVDTAPDNQIGPASAADKDAVIGDIRQIGAGGGGIYVRTGLEAAAAALAESDNQVKHIILLADGSDAEEKQGVPDLIEGLRAEGVTVSTVSIGNGKDTNWLSDVAELGGGRFHFTDRASNLPEIFTQETTAIQRTYLVEERFFPTLASNSPILSSIESVPPLLGYVGTEAKGTAQVILETHLGDPLLATWQYGLGRAVAWTSDATGRWGSNWVNWEGYPVFWAQTVRWSITQGRNSNVETVVQFQEEFATLTVDTRGSDESFLNNLEMEANIVAPDGSAENVTLQQIAPGRYTTDFVPTESGAYYIRVSGTADGEDEAIVAQTAGWVLGYSPEYVDFESNIAQLEAVASIAGGENIAADPAAVFDHSLPSERVTRPIWPWLLLMAVILLPFDIAVRRLVVTRRDMARAWAATFGRLQPEREPVVVDNRSEQVSRLFQAKRRAATGPQPADEQAEAAPAPVMREDASKQTKAAPPRARSGAVGGGKPAGDSTALAARLLKKRREREQNE